MKRNLLLSLLLLLPCLQLSAQHLIGLAGSNRVGSHAVILNPSAIADSRQGFHLNLFTAQVKFANTYYHYDGPGLDFSGIAESLQEGDFEDLLFGDNIFDRAFIRERLDGKPKMAHFGVELRLPSFMLKLSPRHSIAFTTRFRTAIHANNVSEDLARVIGFGTTLPAIRNSMFTDREAYFNTNAFAENSLTYARVLLSREKRFLKGGITVKRLAGLYSSHLLVPELDYRIQQNQDGASYLQVQDGNARFGLSQGGFEFEEADVLNAVTLGDTPGTGWGLDLGFTYEHRPNFDQYEYTLNGETLTDPTDNKYKYRVGFSLLDVGGITYDNPQQVRVYDITRKNLNLNGETFEDVDLENLGPTLEEAFGVQPSEKQTTFRSGLPTALHLNLDYRLTRKFFVNAALIHNLRGKDAIAMRQYSVFAIAPRFESKGLELSVPVMLTNNYRDLNVGAMLRMGSLIIGSNNVAAFRGSSKEVGPDVYVGLGFGISTGGQRAKVEEKERKKARKAAKKAEKQQ